MQLALRPYATAGIALVGTSLIAATPVAAPLPGIDTVRDVTLTAGGSPLGALLAPFIDQYNTAAANATVLTNNFFLAPGVALQQFLANQNDFWGQIFNDPSSIPDVMGQMQQNLSDVLNSYTLLNAPVIAAFGGGLTNEVVDRTLDGGLTLDPTGISVIGHQVLLLLLPGFLPKAIPPDVAVSLTNFLASPMSGALIGTVGPLLSPFVALGNSISAGDGPIEILANTIGAFFNGADLNLDGLVPLLNGSGLLPEGTSIYQLDLALGGLLTPGVVGSAANLAGGGVEVAAPGGSILNSLGLTLDANLQGLALLAQAQSHAIGPIGALEAWSQTIGVLLGSGWSGKGDPEPAVPPLTDFSFPELPAGAAGTDVMSELSDAISQSLGGGGVFGDFISDVF